MIQGELRQNLTPNSILLKISEYDIYRYYYSYFMGNTDWEINKSTFSPFRVENNPSFCIYYSEGRLFFIDFKEDFYKGGCFDFVKMLFQLNNLNEALEKIDNDFGLGIRSVPKDYKKALSVYKQPEGVEKRYSFIQVKTRNFTLDELAYWNSFHQDISDLRANNIFSIDQLYLNKKKVFLRPTELRFGYYYDGRWKIYTPFSQERQKKWFPNNVPITAMDGLKNLTIDKPAFITKSKKDYMVVKKVISNVCAVQNEGIGCFSDNNVNLIKSNSSSQILSFDSDVMGVKNSQKITEVLGFGYCNVPRQYLEQNIKDWAAWGQQQGLKPLEDYFKLKNIIT